MTRPELRATIRRLRFHATIRMMRAALDVMLYCSNEPGTQSAALAANYAGLLMELSRELMQLSAHTPPDDD